MSNTRVSSRRLADAVARAIESGERVTVSEVGRGAVVIDAEDAAIFAGFERDLAALGACYGASGPNSVSVETVQQRLMDAADADAALAAIVRSVGLTSIGTRDLPRERAEANPEQTIRAVTHGQDRIRVMDGDRVVAAIIPSNVANYFALIEDIIDDELARQTLDGTDGDLGDWSDFEAELDRPTPLTGDA